MRIWDLPPTQLCRQHLLGEHRELHALWTVITQKKKGYARHPETRRWRGKLNALYRRHAKLVDEMEKRGYKHRSPLAHHLATGHARQDEHVDSVTEQVTILKHKGCLCIVE